MQFQSVTRVVAVPTWLTHWGSSIPTLHYFSQSYFFCITPSHIFLSLCSVCGRRETLWRRLLRSYTASKLRRDSLHQVKLITVKSSWAEPFYKLLSEVYLVQSELLDLPCILWSYLVVSGLFPLASNDGTDSLAAEITTPEIRYDFWTPCFVSL